MQVAVTGANMSKCGMRYHSFKSAIAMYSLWHAWCAVHPNCNAQVNLAFHPTDGKMSISFPVEE